MRVSTFLGEYHGALGDHTGEAEIGDCLPGFLLPVPGVPCQQQALLAVLNDVVEYGPGTMIAQQRQDIQFTCCEWLEGLELVPGCVERVEFESSDLLPHRIAAIDIEMWQRRLIAENRSPPTHKKTVKVIGVGMTDEQMLQPVEDHAVTCPWHAWRFSVQDGTWVDNPKVKTECYPVRVDGDNIQVVVVEVTDSEGG